MEWGLKKMEWGERDNAHEHYASFKKKTKTKMSKLL